MSRKENVRMTMPTKWRGVRPFERHSLVLLVAGLVFIGIGGSYLFSEMSLARERALFYAFWVMPAEGWGVVFVLIGVLTIVSSRWPPISHTWGYVLLTGQATCWGAFYLVGVIFHGASASYISSVMSWWLIAFMWWAISGLSNPSAIAVIQSPLPDVVVVRTPCKED